MIYEYTCRHCRRDVEIIKSWKDCDRAEVCEECGSVLKRTKWWPDNLSVSASNFEPHFNYAFGKKIHSRAELNETVKVYNATHGTNLYEVGNDNPKIARPKPDIDLEPAKRALYKIRKR